METGLIFVMGDISTFYMEGFHDHSCTFMENTFYKTLWAIAILQVFIVFLRNFPLGVSEGAFL